MTYGKFNDKITIVREYRGIAQLVEQRSPKPRAEGSSPSAPAKGNGLSKDRFLFKRIFKNPLQSHINGVIIKYNKYCKVRSGK